jgi:transposase
VLSVPVQQGYQSFYIYSAVNPCTGDSFSLFLPEISTDIMNLYLQELRKSSGNKKVLLIMDQAGWHKSHDLVLPDNMAIEFLPPYSPELNPVERLWWWLRKEVTHNQIFETLEAMMNALEKEFKAITNNLLASLCHCSYL